jgi:hypothetical protein
MSDSQFALFHFDVKTMSMRDAQGNYLSSGNDQPLIFDTLEAAERYSQAKIVETSALGCRIYDHDGQVVKSFQDDQLYTHHHGRPAAKRSLWLGAALFSAGLFSVALDAWMEWTLTLGVLIGARLLWVGSVKLIDGISTLRD